MAKYSRPAGARFEAAQTYSRSSSHYDTPASGHRGRGGRGGKKWLFAVLGVLLALIVLVGVYAALLGTSVLNVRDIASNAMPAARELVSAVKTGDGAALQSNTQALKSTLDDIQQETSGVVWDIAAHLPVIGHDVASARELITVAGDLIDDALVPMSDTLVAYPLNSLISNGSLNGTAVQALCDALLQVTPTIQSAAESMDSMGEFKIGMLNDLVDQVREPLGIASRFLGKNGNALSVLPTMVGCNGTRSYLVVAQNNAEIRATGGLPGAMTVVTVDNGQISLGEVASLGAITPIAQSPLPITDEERVLFGESLGTTPANMTFTPDFSRAASLISQAWQYCQGQTVDGVVSMDPVMFQWLLGLVGGSATLSDGSVINGDNATEALISDTYWNYFDGDSMDNHFSEAAMAGIEVIQSNLGSVDLTKLLDVVQRGIDEYRLLAWMVNPDEQAVLEDIGCTGTLGTDPATPVLGIYVNDSTWSKIDWYLDFGTVINDSWKNADGSTSYQVTTTLSNLMTWEEASYAPEYVTGYSPEKTDVSDMVTTLYLYAPAGGYVSDVVTSGNIGMSEATHNSLQVLFGNVHLLAQESASVTYTVTTSPEATTDLAIRSTPSVRGN